MPPDPVAGLTDTLAEGVAEVLAGRAARAARNAGSPPGGSELEALRASYAAERAFWNEPRPALASVTEFTLPPGAGGMRMRLYRPAPVQGLPALVFLHGGGFVLGSLDSHDRIQRLLAQRSGAAVLAFDYPLSPEHRFPVALDRIGEAVEWAAGHADELGIDAGRLAIGGDSAGAHLALATALRARDRPRPWSFLLLYYGLYGLRDSASRRRFGGPAHGLSLDDLAFYEASYLGPSADSRDPGYDLLSAGLGGLPPAFLGAAALDPLLDDSHALANALKAAGTSAELRVYDGVLHGFLHWSRTVPAADRAIADGALALARALGTAEATSG
ncbi:alpha/beta hydrolase fold domain-containing protein [Azospirillum sp. SYSU D00513]|uniref:alpha/beta hydrolase fold domain-containing protein n=1 Tax=Azospirillum sp. SYSU D00513 TaxID=2812561 RepID=UPI001A96CE7B|nr:alpha/beta hydrolase fold domain-containing protein [Azospirillum sp. SYSU D00513]